MILYGRNSVFESLRINPKQINKIYLLKTSSGHKIKDVVDLARVNSIPYQFVDLLKIEKITGHKNHQGIVAITLARQYTELETLITKAKSVNNSILCALDDVTDPQNLGSILRNASFFGIIGLIITKRNSAGLTDIAVKVASGAAEHVMVSQVSNIGYAVDKLKKEGFWAIGADSQSGESIHKADFPKPAIVILGSEGAGISRLLKEKCDFLVNIPSCQINENTVPSLNVASASSIIFYELRKSCK
ncbi:MAG: 23S rRNA (guanosine(2251)-2'-O)-methyltransferase RlmB [Elusimicrobia bacterium RIFOXYA2_FULL_39_19]|nr:MAG: 23S rRNA (guanosine(2251)-2'-O)-methyltransferase RlmB [Elusimicrobia bacterium RIFOXYA2_FULL_39_19]